ncbi:SGNH/GDSL hydrolase family protein [Acidipropionibacterium thoenii]|uniref:SGNH/GDSL hydrolase family protein n=1 Tax=Acidipropionibacterium thoenii TaxID=1751 RepID=UPI0009FF1D0D|nr:SGNH/GDSL hydrolase family protein [Acidipropionibacterium thoenii]
MRSRLAAVLMALLVISTAGCARFPSAAAAPGTSSSPVAVGTPTVSSTSGAPSGASSSQGPVSPGTSTASPTPTSTPTLAGHAGRYVTVGLGDSVPSAANCSGCVSYITQVGDRLAERAGATGVVVNDAVAGFTSSQVLDQLGTAAVRSRVADADLVVITVGANDLPDDSDGSCDPDSGCARMAIAELRTRLTTIIQQVRALQTAADAKVVVSGYWNVGVDGAVGRQNGQQYMTTSRTMTRLFNAMVVEVAASQKAIYADFSTPFIGTDGSADPTDLLASDGDHPNAAGHARPADAVVSALGR